MEATNNDAQEVQPQSPDTQDTGTDNQPTQFDGMSQEELKSFALKLSSRLHEVNEESKGRKIKLRELESEKNEREQKLLEEQGEFKKLYESANAELEELRPLRDFKEQHDKLQSDKVLELEKQLTAIEREELSIFSDDLTTDKKIRWIELKLKGRTSVDLDTSSSTRSGGSLKQQPKNRRELRNLNTEEKRLFKEKHPQQYMVAINTP